MSVGLAGMRARLTVAWIAGTLAVGACAVAQAAPPRERILIVAGASTYDYARALVQAFGRVAARLQPSLEAQANGDARAAFCAGVGLGFPDAAVSAGQMSAAEQRACQASGVTPIELKLGLQGVAVAESASAAPIALTRRALFLAAARDVPGPNGELEPNPYRSWRAIDSKLPDRPIHLFVPPAQTSQSESWLDLVMRAGARQMPALADLAARDPAAFAALATAPRETGEVTVLVPEADLRSALAAAPEALAIVDLGATGALKPIAVEGAAPERAKAGGAYPLARPVYLYVKREHLGIVRSLGDFLTEAAGEPALGEGGYLAALGLVPLPARERGAERERVVAVQAKAVTLARNR